MINKSEKFALKLFKKGDIENISVVNTLINKNKIVVFVPPSKIEDIIMAMADKGAGVIGNYSICSFRVNGTGTFKGGKDSNPSVGIKENLESVEEIRLEMICENKYLTDVISNMLKVHPYEEPAYEIYNVITGSYFDGAVKVELKKSIEFKKIIKRINKKLDLENFVFHPNANKIKEIIIDVNGHEDEIEYMTNSKQKILYINKKTNGAINLTLK
jgi:hypothetical protein